MNKGQLYRLGAALSAIATVVVASGAANKFAIIGLF
jgi:hypothetical protein